MYLSCAEMPSQCQRCDDKCAKRDGKRNRHDYKVIKKVPKGKDSVNNVQVCRNSNSSR